MNVKFLDSVQCEDIEYIQSLFNDGIIFALDTMPSIFNKINNKLKKPENYTQGFIMTNFGYLYYYTPVQLDTKAVKKLLIQLENKDNL